MFHVGSYSGGLEAVRFSLRDDAAVAATAAADMRCFSPGKDKFMIQSDPMGILRDSGAHVPLAVFVGGAPARSHTSIDRRRARAAERTIRRAAARGGGDARGSRSGSELRRWGKECQPYGRTMANVGPPEVAFGANDIRTEFMPVVYGQQGFHII